MMKLGIVYKNGKVINHRSLIKVLFNPILSRFGICIATKFCLKTNLLGFPLIIKSSGIHRWKDSLLYDAPPGYYDRIDKVRRLI